MSTWDISDFVIMVVIPWVCMAIGMVLAILWSARNCQRDADHDRARTRPMQYLDGSPRTTSFGAAWLDTGSAPSRPRGEN